MALWYPMSEEECDDACWAPLEQVARLTRESPSLEAMATCEFMFMARVDRRRRPSIWLYKHSWTRRYLNLDDAGHAYRFIAPRDVMSDYGGRYVLHRSLVDALEHLELWFADEDWRAERLRDCPAHDDDPTIRRLRLV